MKKVGVLGLWHLGCTYGACLADLGFNVIGFDLDKKVVENLQKSTLPIFEPGLEELVKKYLGKNLTFTNSIKDAVVDCDYAFVTLDTPVDKHDVILMRSFNHLTKEIRRHVQPNTILVISSQVPVGTCRDLLNQMRSVGKKNQVLYFPENLRLGQAIEGFQKPDRIVLGGEERARKQFLSDFSFQCPILGMSLESAEMSKHALNSFLALMISFSSEIGDLCEKLGADANDVMNTLKLDQRVSPKAPISPGFGFAGGTLGRDLQTLKLVSRKVKYTPKLIKAVYEVNLDRLPYLIQKVSNILGNLKDKNIGLLGLTYKPNTDTLRRSQSLDLAALLKRKGVNIRAIDPVVDGSQKEVKLFKVCKEYEEFFSNLDTVILMTGWEEFRKLNPKDFFGLLRHKIVFDTKNFLDKEAYIKTGFLYIGIGSSEKVSKALK